MKQTLLQGIHLRKISVALLLSQLQKLVPWIGLRTQDQKERHAIALKGAAALRERGIYQSKEYRDKRSKIAVRLINEGRIPDPKTWTKFKKGEGAWLGKETHGRPQVCHRKRGARFFSEHPEMKLQIADKVRRSLADPDGKYRTLVKTGFFKEASKRA